MRDFMNHARHGGHGENQKYRREARTSKLQWREQLVLADCARSVYVQNTMPYSVCLCGLCASVVMESRRETPHRGIRYAVDGPCRHATPRGGKRQGL